MHTQTIKTVLPGEAMDVAKMPGHWILARLGKRVLRPGGMGLTLRMLGALAIEPSDDVVEFAPGLGKTARRVLEGKPASYIAVERDPAAADVVRRWLDENQATRRVITGQAQDTKLPDGCATVVFGEAMLTMQPETRRRQIIAEGFRLLKPGGRYGIHELGLILNDSQAAQTECIRKKITEAIHHQAYPMQIADWQRMVREQGFEVERQFTAPMALLEPRRVIHDEGWLGALRFAFRVLTHVPERRRVQQMHRVFRELRPYLTAVSLIARKPQEKSS